MNRFRDCGLHSRAKFEPATTAPHCSCTQMCVLISRRPFGCARPADPAVSRGPTRVGRVVVPVLPVQQFVPANLRFNHQRLRSGSANRRVRSQLSWERHIRGSRFRFTIQCLNMSFYKLPHCSIRGRFVIFTPLDEGHVVTVNPREVDYWCAQFGCTEAQLVKAVARVGEHVADVRRELMYAEDPFMDRWSKKCSKCRTAAALAARPRR